MSTLFQDHNALLSALPIEPQREMGAYEALWESETASFKTIAETFEQKPSATPCQLVPAETIDATVPEVMRHLDGSCRWRAASHNFCSSPRWLLVLPRPVTSSPRMHLLQAGVDVSVIDAGSGSVRQARMPRCRVLGAQIHLLRTL
jgi:hypothetical protein